MKAPRELFNSKERESADLYERLQQHQAQQPAIMRQYNEADVICVELAAKLNAAATAGSPSAMAIEADLRRARWSRDDIKQRYSREGTQIRDALEAITRPLIQEFNESCLQRLKDISKHFRTFHIETYTAVNDKQYAVIKDNAQALENAREEILKAIRGIRNFQCRSLADLRTEIERYFTKFDGFAFDAMVEKKVTLGALRLARNDRKPEPSVDAGKVNELSARIGALERK
jgi:hypothetical protein